MFTTNFSKQSAEIIGVLLNMLYTDAPGDRAPVDTTPTHERTDTKYLPIWSPQQVFLVKKCDQYTTRTIPDVWLIRYIVWEPDKYIVAYHLSRDGEYQMSGVGILNTRLNCFEHLEGNMLDDIPFHLKWHFFQAKLDKTKQQLAKFWQRLTQK